MIHVDLTGAAPFFGAHTPDYAAAEAAHRTLSEKTGAGSDFLGWTELPRRIRETELARISPRGKRSVKRATRSSLSASADRISAHARPMS